MHKQVVVKVNALVDKGIADLVSVLSSFDGVFTYESCQSSILGAYICLHYGSPLRPSLADTVQFADILAKLLDGTECTVSVEWLTVPTVILRLQPEAITEVTTKLVCHKSQCLHGKHGKASDPILDSIDMGMAESASGQVVNRGSFSQYVDDES
jgi:hypothetical protein